MTETETVPESLSNDVFISYRRDVGGILAMALHQQLTAKGVNAFYDIESLRAGQFDSIILNQVAARPYFVLVLTPGTLERCRETDDWLRREIEQALITARVIVPVYTPSFNFDDLERFLPAEVGREVARFNGQELPQQFFLAAVQRLVEGFLLPIPLENAPAPPATQPVVDRILDQAASAPTVTDADLSAQEFFERAVDRTGDLMGTIADYDEAIRLNPAYVDAYNNRGLARKKQGDVDGALADYDEAIRLNPAHVDAYNNRGVVRSDLGDVDGALADYDKAIRLNPEYVLVLQQPRGPPERPGRCGRRTR